MGKYYNNHKNIHTKNLLKYIHPFITIDEIETVFFSVFFFFFNYSIHLISPINKF